MTSPAGCPGAQAKLKLNRISRRVCAQQRAGALQGTGRFANRSPPAPATASSMTILQFCLPPNLNACVWAGTGGLNYLYLETTAQFGAEVGWQARRWPTSSTCGLDCSSRLRDRGRASYNDTLIDRATRFDNPTASSTVSARASATPIRRLPLTSGFPNSLRSVCGWASACSNPLNRTRSE